MQLFTVRRSQCHSLVSTALDHRSSGTVRALHMSLHKELKLYIRSSFCMVVVPFVAYPQVSASANVQILVIAGGMESLQHFARAKIAEHKLKDNFYAFDVGRLYRLHQVRHETPFEEAWPAAEASSLTGASTHAGIRRGNAASATILCGQVQP